MALPRTCSMTTMWTMYAVISPAYLINGQVLAQPSREPNKCFGGWSFGKLRFEWLNRIVTSTNDDGMNWQVMRYADIYLMAAEAINELDNPTSAAPYLKPILDRSYPAAKATAILTAASASKTAFFNEIVDQQQI